MKLGVHKTKIIGKSSFFLEVFESSFYLVLNYQNATLLVLSFELDFNLVIDFKLI